MREPLRSRGQGGPKPVRPHAGSKRFRDYARERAASRLGRMAFELRHCRKAVDADRIHDLRVSVRRFTETLRVFRGVLPDKPSRRVRKELRKIMQAAGAVRNIDIAIELLRDAGVGQDWPVMERLEGDRRNAEHRLEEAVRRAYRKDQTSRWREELGLSQ